MLNLATRFASERLANDVRSSLLKQPHRAIDEPDALQVMIGAALPADISFQLKVSEPPCLLTSAGLSDIVPPLLGSCQPCNSSSLFLTRIQQQSKHHSICYACS